MRIRMFENIEAILFDLDGTLVDSMWMWEQIDVEYLARFGHAFPEDLQSKIEGMSFSETAKYFKQRFNIPDGLDKMKQDWNQMAWDKYQHEVKYKPGAEEFLKNCKNYGMKMGIATSNSRELVQVLNHSLNLQHYISEIHTSCEVPRGKPAPDIYLLVAEKLGVEPKNCLVFEDVVQGIQAGKAAGMRVCAVADEFSKEDEVEKRKLADYWMDDFSQLCTERMWQYGKK